MRILFTPLAMHTHLFGMIPLAWACRAAGHDVRVASQPRILDTITRAGLPAVMIGAGSDFQTEAVAFLRSRPEQLRTAAGGGAPGAGPADPWVRTAQACAPELVAFGRSWRPDLVVGDPMVYAAPLVAEVLGVPFVRLLWSPDWPKAGLGMGGYPAQGQLAVRWPRQLTELFESYGARTAVDFAACTLDPFPPSLRLPGLANRVPMRPIPYNGSGVEPGWLALPPDRPRVCISWGTNTTVYMGERGFLVPQILAGLADLDLEIVLLLSGPDLARLGPPPAGARVAEGLPLELLIPSCAAIINQGGAVVMATVAVHGVPQVVVPMMADQPTNAQLLAATGAGIPLDPGYLDTVEVKSAVASAVFDESTRAAARRLQAEIRELPTPAQIVDVLERLG
jgi:UDP:flavonoid glycosyltransferase YjiC (YdhE family)